MPVRDFKITEINDLKKKYIFNFTMQKTKRNRGRVEKKKVNYNLIVEIVENVFSFMSIWP